MSNYETEEEQIAAIKEWWKQNGTAILIGVSIGLAGLFGWKAWQSHQSRVVAEASSQYMQVLDHLRTQQFEKVVSAADLVINDYAKSSYAALSGLAKVKAQVELKQQDAAIDSAQQVLTLAKGDDIKAIAQLRLAQLYLSKADYTAGLAALDAINIAQFKPQADLIRGDIYLSQGDKAAAISAYKNALDAKDTELNSQLRVIATLKYESLAGKYEPSS